MAVFEPIPNQEGVYSYTSTNAFLYVYAIDPENYVIRGAELKPTPENPNPATAGKYKLFINEDTSLTGKNALTDALNAYTES